VVPIEDLERIVDMQDSIVRLPCVCRRLTTGREARYCFGVGADWAGTLGPYPDISHGLETLGREEAKAVLRSFDERGLVHSVWTFNTPFIGGICNCDHDCVAYRVQVKAKLMPLMFRGEYVARVDPDVCTGCRRCFTQCQFGAIHYSSALGKAWVEMEECFGCGVCRAACAKGAIRLEPRSRFPGLPW
jgi:ferredoxin